MSPITLLLPQQSNRQWSRATTTATQATSTFECLRNTLFPSIWKYVLTWTRQARCHGAPADLTHVFCTCPLSPVSLQGKYLSISIQSYRYKLCVGIQSIMSHNHWTLSDIIAFASFYQPGSRPSVLTVLMVFMNWNEVCTDRLLFHVEVFLDSLFLKFVQLLNNLNLNWQFFCLTALRKYHTFMSYSRKRSFPIKTEKIHCMIQ